MYILQFLFAYWSAEILIIKKKLKSDEFCAYRRIANYTSNFSTTANSTSLLYLIKALRYYYNEFIRVVYKDLTT